MGSLSTRRDKSLMSAIRKDERVNFLTAEVNQNLMIAWLLFSLV